MKRRLFFLQRIILVSLALIVIFTVSGCGSGKELVSVWPGQAIQIDGNIQDWQNNLQSYPKEKYSIGLRNDEKFLYLCLTMADKQTIFNSIRTGINVSFESQTDPAKNYTIKFPLVNPTVFNEAISDLGDEAFEKEGISFLFQDVLNQQTTFNLSQTEVVNVVLLKNNIGIELKTGSTNELLIFEVKVPLASTKFQFPVGVLPGEKLGVKIFTDPAVVAFREASTLGQNASRGNERGSRGSRSGGGAYLGSGDGGRTVITEKFEAGFTIQLAKEAIKN